MAFGSDANDTEVMSEINMTPLVDVMLVLLIIFIITVPVLTHTVKIELPTEAATPTELQPKSITLSVTEQAQLYWNDELITQSELERRLQQAASATPQPEFQLRGARQVDYEHVVHVMSAVQQAGITTLGFMTEVE